MGRFAAILFDLDGTLLDTLGDLGNSMNDVLSRRGWPTHPLDAYRIFVGDGVGNLVRRAMPPAAAGDEALVRDVVEEMRREYGGRWHDLSRPYDGVEDLLAGAAARGLRLGVLSNKPHPATVAVVAHFFPPGTFDVVLGARAGVPIKPDPGAALEAASALGVEPSRVLYLGDTNTDMLTARAAGMHAVGAAWGFRDADELRAAGAARLAASPGDVLEMLG